METILIDTIEKAQQIFFDQPYDAEIGRYRGLYVYRGLPDASYELVSGLRRMCKQHKDTVEPHLLNNFAKYAEMEAPTVEASIWRKMIIGQHHGLPTRLLDWSRSPMMALHFATTEADLDMMDRRDCAVWRVDISALNRLLPDVYRERIATRHQGVFTEQMLGDVCGNGEDALKRYDSDMGTRAMVMLEPPTIDMRIANQYAYFSVVPSAVRRVEDILDLCTSGVTRYIIPKELRWRVRDMLDQCNINERVVYPGLDGIAAWMSRYYYARSLDSGTEKQG